MIQNLADITYKGKSIAWGLVLGKRRYGYDLKKHRNPLWARSETTKNFLSIPQFKSNETVVYIPFKYLKEGDVLTVQDGRDHREKWTLKKVCKTAIEYEVEPVEFGISRRDYKTLAAEPEPVTLEPAPENDGCRKGRIETLHEKGFSLPALEALNNTDLEQLFEDFGR